MNAPEEVIRCRNHQGADEANWGGVSYKIHPDKCFYIDAPAADHLCGDGRSGFFPATPSEFHPPAGSVSLSECESMILGLAPGRPKTALLAALLSLDLLVTN